MARLLVILVAIACALGAQAQPLDARALGDALRRGGHVIYFRHAATDFSQNDAAMTSFEDCARQRNLTDAGRDDAREIGAAIKRARIPVGEVLASPYCRTMETARLIFGRATASHAVRGGPASSEGDRYRELKALFASGAPADTNLAIASHGNPFHAVAGPPYLAEGEAAIIARGCEGDWGACARDGRGGFTVIGRVGKTGWDALAPR